MSSCSSCRKSHVWKFFEQEGASVSCSLCQTKLSYHGSTLSMKEHLKRKHPVDFENQAEKDVPRKQQKLDVFTRKSLCSTERAAIISNLKAGVIIKDLRPMLDEVDLFLQEKALNREESPLLWWRANHHRFPLIAVFARKYLSVPATSTPAERVFSTAGLTVTSSDGRYWKYSIDMIRYNIRHLSVISIFVSI